MTSSTGLHVTCRQPTRGCSKGVLTFLGLPFRELTKDKLASESTSQAQTADQASAWQMTAGVLNNCCSSECGHSGSNSEQAAKSISMLLDQACLAGLWFESLKGYPDRSWLK